MLWVKDLWLLNTHFLLKIHQQEPRKTHKIHLIPNERFSIQKFMIINNCYPNFICHLGAIFLLSMSYCILSLYFIKPFYCQYLITHSICDPSWWKIFSQLVVSHILVLIHNSELCKHGQITFCLFGVCFDV